LTIKRKTIKLTIKLTTLLTIKLTIKLTTMTMIVLCIYNKPIFSSVREFSKTQKAKNSIRKRMFLNYLLILSLLLCVTAFDVRETSVDRIRDAFKSGELSSCAELVDLFAARIAKLEPKLNAFVSISSNSSLRAQAARLDSMSESKRASMALWCVPVAVKDNFATGVSEFPELPTTVGSASLATQFGRVNAAAVQQLINAGCVLLGKTNMAEFAIDGSNTNSSVAGQTRNVYDASRTPMGSSGGSATAVASSMCVLALGSDTQGSIQNPASAQALFGLRSTQGMLVGDGVFPLLDVQDVVGPLARSASDLAYAMRALDVGGLRSGAPGQTWMPRGRYAVAPPPPSVALPLASWRIGVLNSTLNSLAGIGEVGRIDADVQRGLVEAVGQLRALGADIVVLEHVADRLALLNLANAKDINGCAGAEEHASWNYYLRTSVTADSPVHSIDALMSALRGNSREPRALVDQIEQIFARASPEGAAVYTPSCGALHYWKVSQARVIENAMLEHRLDGFAFATMLSVASKLGTGTPSMQFSYIASSTGLPALVVPAGMSTSSSAPVPMPYGLTFMTRRYQESHLIDWALAFESRYPKRIAPQI
jgi:Asp-tRNA(Asn)/Glu-tRNA(Gln) amidotransferase A subunit family amidase